MIFKTTTKDITTGQWSEGQIEIISISAPRNVRGRISGSNWAVDYEVSSTLGNTGKKTNTIYFSTKKEAINWIDIVKESAIA